MKTSEIFEELLTNLQVDNAGTIGARRDEITKVLNKEFRNLDSSENNQLMVGSYGRFTAIRGISDLDMLYVLPSSLWDKYEGENGPSDVLSRTCTAIQARYPTSSVKVDSPVVVVTFQNFMFEVQPVFEQEDGSFSTRIRNRNPGRSPSRATRSMRPETATASPIAISANYASWRVRGRTSTA